MRLTGTRWRRLALPAADGRAWLGGACRSARQGLVLVGDTEGDGGFPPAVPLVVTGR